MVPGPSDLASAMIPGAGSKDSLFLPLLQQPLDPVQQLDIIATLLLEIFGSLVRRKVRGGLKTAVRCGATRHRSWSTPFQIQGVTG